MEERTIECTVCYYRATLAHFTPVTASADFTALECPNCLTNSHESFQEILGEPAQQKAA